MKICIFEEKGQIFSNVRLKNDISYLFKTDLYREWKIWSKCLGKIVVVNGVSSSGKSTLSEYFSNLGFNIISLDSVRDNLMLDYASKNFGIRMLQMKGFLTDSEILKVLFGFKFTEAQHNGYEIEFIQDFQKSFFSFIQQDANFLTLIQIFDQMYNLSQKFIFSGQDVLLDVMAYGEQIDMLHYSFRYYPLKLGLLYSPLEENLTKCFQRNYLSSKKDLIEYRYPSDILSQYIEFYQFVNRDNVYKYKNVLEKIDKESVKNILEIAIHCQFRLLNTFKNQLIADEAVCFIDKNKMKKMCDLVETFKNFIMLESFEEVFVVPNNVEYDFIIRTSDLNLMCKKLISNINPYDEIALSEEVLKFCQYENDFKENDSKSNMLVCSKSTHEMEQLPNMRFIIYRQEELPLIIGNSGPVVEFEYDNQLKLLGDYDSSFDF